MHTGDEIQILGGQITNKQKTIMYHAGNRLAKYNFKLFVKIKTLVDLFCNKQCCGAGAGGAEIISDLSRSRN